MPRLEIRIPIWLKLRAKKKAESSFKGNISAYVKKLITKDTQEDKTIDNQPT